MGRGELTALELSRWTFLVSAAANAMLEVLPQLEGGCINYWDAGNWALNDQAHPKGPKRGPDHRRVHMHLLGRSRGSTHPSWVWGEAPKFPDYADRHEWSSAFKQLTAEENARVVDATERCLLKDYGFVSGEIAGRVVCRECGYPTVATPSAICSECGEKSAG